MPEPNQINRPSERPPIWIRTPEALRALAARTAGARILALDSESDSLHHFPEKVCLVQLASEDGAVYLVDPLSLPDLGCIGPILADPAILKVFHGASYDLSCMKRDFGFAFSGIFDTMLAAQFLGLPELGLNALLQRFLGITPGKSRQKDDWAKRPLQPEQETYAAEDVRHLISLREHLRAELLARGREAWLEEECQALVVLPPAERVFDPEQYLRLKGARDLDRRGLAVLRELFVARETWAHAAGRPPFKVLGNESLIRVARDHPRALETLLQIPGCSPKVVQRYGVGVLAAVTRGLAIPEAELPVYPRPKKPRLSPAVQRRIEALLAWRVEAAGRLGLDPGLVLPRRLIEGLAEEAPATPDALERIEGLRRWRAETFGAEILRVLESAPAERSSRQGPTESLASGER
ncbi:MAG TPA: HRDC domain-containing protein [Candidatus Acidoferrum sp.]|nr:HRDC domain-containing protein [Candidatus Acidoferrum sp.]